MADILVRGRAEARLAPTAAHMTITVKVAGAPTQAEAVDRAAIRCRTVDAAVDGRRNSLVRGAVDYSVRTGQEWDYSGQKGRRLIGYFATRSTEVECEPNGEALTAFLREVGEIEQVQVNGPRWAIAPDAAGYDALREAAGADARRKAESYAAGLGSRIGSLLWIAEPGLRIGGDASGGPSPEMMAAASPRAMKRGGGPGQDEDEPLLVRVKPEPITVSVTVEVGFALVEG